MKTGYVFFPFSRRIFAIVVILSSVLCIDDERIYMNQFAVHIDGNLDIANRIAAKHGFINHGQIGGLDGHYLFEHNHVKKRATDPSHHHHDKLHGESEVLWVQQQSVLKRVKRDLNYPDFDTGRVSFLSNFGTNFRPSYGGEFPDPLYSKQWYLHKGAADRWDMNVLGAWKKGYTGYGVVVSILDDGIQTNHPDLVRNYDSLASTDINGNDDDPMPQDNGDNKHGTRCAGEVAAVAFNDICGVGIAFNASIGGVRMLDGTVNDAVEAKALSLNRNHIDIYSASWGPEDDGKTVDGPGPMARRAFIDGVTQGRNYKGSIFVWASGNGGRHTDNCNCDGYTNSIFTLSISSVTQRGLKPWYLEECSSTLTTTYSSGTPGHDKNVVTVDMDPTFSRDTMCTQDHTGTSASAPIAAAICALALEANPNLTWRDMQYLVVLTSRPEPLMKEDGWQVNGVNRKVSHKFGYGLMDATAMVNLAEQWLSVPNQHICETLEDAYQRPIPKGFGEKLEIYMNTDACWNTANVVNYLEHVQCRLTLHHNPRGNLKIILESPSGTRSVLLSPRPKDVYQTDFQDWPFLSVHFWGERAAGQWKLTIVNAGSNPTQQPGILKKWSLVFHGTEQHPIHLRSHSSSEYQFSPVGRATVVQIREDSQSEDCHRECRGGCYGNGADKCQECRHFRTDTGMCVRTCSEGEFADVNNTCTQCHASCKTCHNATSSACLSCDGAMFVEGRNECVKYCPHNYFSRDRICSQCDKVCDSCTGKSSNCSRCRYFSHGGICVASCPRSTFESVDRQCLNCHGSCETCTGPSEFHCITCPQNSVHLNGTCVDHCPFGFYSDVNECYACDSSCATCNSTHCLSCRPSWSLTSSGQCRLQNRCENGQFFDERCLPCHKSCDSCDGVTYSQCLTCPPHSILYKNTCIKKCPANTVYVANECVQCHDTCQKCAGPEANQCISCRAGLILKNGFCSTVCGERMYASTNVCLRCHETCLTCRGPAFSDCITCVPGMQLGEGKCEKSCSPGTFPRNSSCINCHHTCQTCIGNDLNDCLSCHDSFILDTGMCMECQRGLFYYRIAQQCRQCDVSCTTCNGPDEFSCLSCTQPLKHDSVKHRCVPCCESLVETNCCICNSKTDSCINEVNAEKRRTDTMLEKSLFNNGSKLPTGFSLGTFSVVAVCTCLLVISMFLVVLKMLRQYRSKCKDWTHDYQLLPLEKYDQEEFWEGNDHIRT